MKGEELVQKIWHVQRLCHDSNSPILPMAVKILMNEADGNSDRVAS